MLPKTFLGETLVALGRGTPAFRSRYTGIDTFFPARPAPEHLGDEQPPSDHPGAGTGPYPSGPAHPAGSGALDARPVRVVRPAGFTSAGDIGRTYREGNRVIVSLETVEDDVAKRLVDFMAGLVCYASGSIEQVASRVFLLHPENSPAASGPEHPLVEVIDLDLRPSGS